MYIGLDVSDMLPEELNNKIKDMFMQCDAAASAAAEYFHTIIESSREDDMSETERLDFYKSCLKELKDAADFILRDIDKIRFSGPGPKVREIRFDQTSKFLGRNGYFKMAGLEVFKNDQGIELQPITTKNLRARCSISIPSNKVGEVTEAFSELK